jgi:hypothetical protein
MILTVLAGCRREIPPTHSSTDSQTSVVATTSSADSQTSRIPTTLSAAASLAPLAPADTPPAVHFSSAKIRFAANWQRMDSRFPTLGAVQ